MTINATYDLVEVAETIQLADDPGSPFTLAPGEKTNMTADLPILDADLIGALTNGTKAIFLLAKVDYLDVFGEPRRTRMRASSIGVKKVGIDGSIQLEWYGEDNDLT